ncbi:S41 family peptidase [Candidatus Parcubacteria bacterium]|nr:S41 family peptidase [Candidatus Parcubacteria bacterium]
MAGKLNRGYNLAINSNPSGECDYLVLGETWFAVSHQFYKEVTKKQIYNYALEGIKKALGKHTLDFYSNKSKKYSAWYFWPLVVRASRISGKSKSELCYATIEAIVKKLDDPYKGFYVPKKAKKAIKWMIAPKEYRPEPVATCKKYEDVIYCKILVFDSRTTAEFLSVFSPLKNGSKKFILDLRDSKGGLTEVCREMLGLLWLGRKTAYMVIDSNGKKSPVYATFDGTPLLKGFRSVVLINRNTYSSSEFFSSAVKDYKSAVLIGEKTYGKGMLQYSHFLRGGGVLRISMYHVLSPRGKKLNGFGVVPDIYIKDKNDAPLKKALEVLK